ncbi:NAD(P)-binding Rossmann-fold superfamily protein [Raphanus sativus]|uniref:Salutaridine reductase-like n=1 Tax=Raphanus sativus TaxID=3726 RepID=A0A9W3C497_RAPSA|nr:salutaridine reductase-like [Raphanus sativus]KAJ4884978.1 NAD(P)-binding Rossmann-fold superfamily protein [Raphanus sativus]
MDHLISLLSPIPPSDRWWSEETTAVVTGANKGIGFEVVKKLLKRGLTVVLTARNAENGSIAFDSLRRAGFRNVLFFCLDVSDPSSIAAFVSWFRLKFGVLDILVNNAAISFNAVGENSIREPETIIKTNYYGAKLLTDALLPLFRRSASVGRILNISSRLGALNKLRNPTLRQTLESEELTYEQIDTTVTQFLEDVRRGTYEKKGWPYWSDYAVSKMALNAYSRVLARHYDGKKLSVNCFCPGFTRTSMTGGQGTYTAEEVAATIARLVLIPPEKLTSGKFFMCVEPNKIISRL